MKKLVLNPKPPFPLYRKKEDGSFDLTLTQRGDEVWACGECGILHTRWVQGKEGEQDQQKRAAECCLQKICVTEGCGQPAQTYYIDQKCSGCHDLANQIVREAKAVEVEDLKAIADDPIYCHELDRYWHNMGELEDWINDKIQDEKEYGKDEEERDLPEWVYPCSAKSFSTLDADDVLEHELSEHYEDARDAIVDIEGLQKFLNEWCEKQTLKSYEPDYSRKIRVSRLLPTESETKQAATDE